MGYSVGGVGGTEGVLVGGGGGQAGELVVSLPEAQLLRAE